MATSRLWCLLRREIKSTVWRNGCKTVRKEPGTWKAYMSCLKKMRVPLLVGNAGCTMSFLGLSWGSPKEDKKQEVKKENEITSIITEADRLYSENEAVALYDYLIQFKDRENDEILWRLARAAVDKGKLSSSVDEKKALYYEAFGYIKMALALNEENFAVHKWYAILLDYTGEFEGTKQRITNAFEVKEHFLRAIQLNPKDATSIHSLGFWCFTFAEMPWYQRAVASSIYTKPPTSTFDEALKYFLQAEETEPNFYSMNLLMLGKTYMRLKNAEMAFTYLLRCREYPVKTPDDQKAHDEAIQLLKVMGLNNRPELDRLVQK